MTLVSSGYLVCLLVLNFLAFSFLCWVLQFVYKAAHSIVSSESEREEVLCPCLFFRRVSRLRFAMLCTVSAVTVWALCSATALVWGILAVARSDCWVPGKREDDSSRSALTLLMAGLCTFWLATGHLLMFVTHFERLRLTFENSALALPKWASKLAYALLALFGVLTLVLFGFRYTQPIISSACIALFILLFCASVGALIHGFFTKTMAIVRDAHDADASLVETAVRITVVVTLALLTTSASLMLWILFYNICPHCLFWSLLRLFVLISDMCFNAFCLMCTFGKAEAHYQCVFGAMHSRFVARILAAANRDTATLRPVASLSTASQLTSQFSSNGSDFSL